jgi:hypothetical protein
LEIRIISNLCKQQKYEFGNENIPDENGQHKFPAPLHQLIVAESRQRPSNQQQEPAEEEHLKGESRKLQECDKQMRHSVKRSPGQMKSIRLEMGTCRPLKLESA